MTLRPPVLRKLALLGSTFAVFAATATTSAASVPRAADYHALLVLGGDPATMLLGTHRGVYRSTDGGRSWRLAGLAGQDAMNLVQARGAILMGGHDVFAVSVDGGKTWRPEHPTGLPTLDVHGLAVDPTNPRVVYAQIAMTGLYRSTDGGRSFHVVSRDVNGPMMSVAVTPAGKLVVGDMTRGIYLSTTGRRWLHTATGMVMGLAVDPRDANRILATGDGIAISKDGGRTWSAALRSKVMFGPVAWSPSNPNLAYAVSDDRSLWRSIDGGKTWSRTGTG
jgi:photosystem II stability/assembly factor-like uncharacterized protein